MYVGIIINKMIESQSKKKHYGKNHPQFTNVTGKSQNQRVMKSSSNIGTGDENFDCRIAGETTDTYIHGLRRPFWQFIRLNIGAFFYLFGIPYNLPYYNGLMDYISFGHCYYDGQNKNYIPSKGWVHTNGLNGVVKWEGELYGDIIMENWWISYSYKTWKVIYRGVRTFTGLFIDKLGKSPCYLGHANHVKISYEPDTATPPYYYSMGIPRN